MSFTPPCCPSEECPSRDRRCEFRFTTNGTYRRACDRRTVRRFRCLVCRIGFSEQTFRATYRQKLPHLNSLVAWELVSKVSLRQAARKLGVNRKSVVRRLPLLGSAAYASHKHLAPERDLEEVSGPFLLDELETYAESRRNNPLTVPVLIHRGSFFVVEADVGPLPRRGGKGRDERVPGELDDEERARRNAGSRVAVGFCCEALAEFTQGAAEVVVRTDEKRSYPGLLRKALGNRLVHLTTSSKLARNTRNPLFRINLTLAMMRDGVSRLVRRTWAASKRQWRLWQHLWVWFAYRNYVRGMTNEERHETPAMQLGITDRPVTFDELLQWRPPYVDQLLRL